jgi:hypothetical protein
VLLILDKESTSYSYFYTSLISLLSAGSRCDVLKRQKSKFVNLSDAKIVRCLFGMCWRLLLSLPPPVSFLSRLQQNQAIELKVSYETRVDDTLGVCDLILCDQRSIPALNSHLMIIPLESHVRRMLLV